MKAHAMAKFGPAWEAIAILLGQSDNVSYVEWQEAMLEKEREYDTGSVYRGTKVSIYATYKNEECK